MLAASAREVEGIGAFMTGGGVSVDSKQAAPGKRIKGC